MELLAFTLPSFCGAMAAWLAKRGPVRFWLILVTIWLGVPLGLVSSLLLGFSLKDYADCSDPLGRPVAECVAFGFDITDWVNGSTAGGYAIAFVGLPWLAIGAVIMVVVLVFHLL